MQKKGKEDTGTAHRWRPVRQPPSNPNSEREACCALIAGDSDPQTCRASQPSPQTHPRQSKPAPHLCVRVCVVPEPPIRLPEVVKHMDAAAPVGRRGSEIRGSEGGRKRNNQTTKQQSNETTKQRNKEATKRAPRLVCIPARIGGPRVRGWVGVLHAACLVHAHAPLSGLHCVTRGLLSVMGEPHRAGSHGFPSRRCPRTGDAEGSCAAVAGSCLEANAKNTSPRSCRATPGCLRTAEYMSAEEGGPGARGVCSTRQIRVLTASGSRNARV